MKKYLLALVAASLCTACEQKADTPATTPVTNEKTTIVTPPAAGSDTKTETSTTVTPPAPAAGATESKTTTQTKTEPAK